MFMTRECDYAVRIVRELSDNEKKTSQEICEKELIPQQFTYKVLRKLEKNGIVESYRGIKGGYQLACPASEVTLYDIFMSVEDDFFLNECMHTGIACPRNKQNAPCIMHNKLCQLQDIIIDWLKSVSAEDISSIH